MNKEQPSDKVPTVAEMKMRDYFAAHALAGLCSQPHLLNTERAEKAYKCADAMLNERKEIE